MILLNAIHCNHCGDTIESEYRHHYIRCKCGRVAADGGRDYLKRAFKEEGDYDEVSIVEPEEDENAST